MFLQGDTSVLAEIRHRIKNVELIQKDACIKEG